MTIEQAVMELMIHKYLASFSRRELRQKIRQFRNLNFRKLSYSGIQQAVENVIAVRNPDIGQGPSWGMPYKNAVYSKGTKFFRVRPFVDGKNPVSTVDDCWYPPSTTTRIGRVNMDGQPVLYTSPANPTVAATEMDVMDGRPFVLLEYMSIDDVEFSWIGNDTTELDSMLDEEETEKVEMLRDFLVDEFTRDVGTGTEYLYQITNIIAREYFDRPNISGYCYPSIARKDGFLNTCFFAEQAKSKLELIGIAKLRFWDAGNTDVRVMCNARFRVAENGVDIIREE